MSLDKSLRKQLENAVKKGRRVADVGARKALEALAVGHAEPWPSMRPEERELRNRLRAHGRQLGDKVDAQKGTQAIAHLAAETAYEHWHRILFARFLAENELLIEPESQVAVSIDEVRELARGQGVDWIDLAASWAQRMLPQIFRSGDPVLEVALPPEERHEVEEIVASLPREVFLADDSLGWVYQFWQAEKKDEVNKSGKKIGADELPAVTQLFTEDYMVDFLLDNTLGAWWAGKKFAENPELARIDGDDHVAIEEELRRRVSLPNVDWSYLRFTKQDAAQSSDELRGTLGSPNEATEWIPAAGTFDGWPKPAKEITCLDPCMGSGHFIVAMFIRLVAMRMAEESLNERSATAAVITQNLFGLEIDPRCAQIAAFNLALITWKRLGDVVPVRPNLACSGTSPNATVDQWLAVVGGGADEREAMRQLWNIFRVAPVVGSLIDPVRVGGDLFTATFDKVRGTLEAALRSDSSDVTTGELAVSAQGIVSAAALLCRDYVLVATNVPYLGRGAQDPAMKEYCENFHADSKADLATCFVDRSLSFVGLAGTVALVTPQYWLFLAAYKRFRERLLKAFTWICVGRLGTGAFDSISGEVVNVAMPVISKTPAAKGHQIASVDVSAERGTAEKASALVAGRVNAVRQSAQLGTADSRVTLEEAADFKPLGMFVHSTEGLSTGDSDRFIRQFWEFEGISEAWAMLQDAPTANGSSDGISRLVLWEGGAGELSRYSGARIQGHAAWNRPGVLVGRMGAIRSTVYHEGLFDKSCVVLSPKNLEVLPAVYAFCQSAEFETELRKLDKKMGLATSVPLQVPFDVARWTSEAEIQFPSGIPKLQSTELDQALFDGHPVDSVDPLQTATAILIGYKWPRSGAPAQLLSRVADRDGIVSLARVKGENAAAPRLLQMLEAAYGGRWSGAQLNAVLDAAGYGGMTLEDWLHGFFAEHCDRFHQRPFIWQIWDGLNDGFSALVNYHKLAAPNGEGRKTLEKLLYSYLGDWTERQRNDQKRGVEGADLRLAAAEHLASELEKILHGEPPYDIFVRWKPLHEQPIGWEPDINDGVRINIRPFMMAKPFKAKGKNACILRATPNIKWGPKPDRGNEPMRANEDYPWFWEWDGHTVDFAGGSKFDGRRWNDLHYTRAFKEAARRRAQER